MVERDDLAGDVAVSGIGVDVIVDVSKMGATCPGWSWNQCLSPSLGEA